MRTSVAKVKPRGRAQVCERAGGRHGGRTVAGTRSSRAGPGRRVGAGRGVKGTSKGHTASSWASWADAKIRGMTIKERLHKLVDELSEAKAAETLSELQSGTAAEPPEMLSAPKSWGWEKTAWGDPMPNVVAWVAESRQGR
jgi:hypothetical protein